MAYSISQVARMAGVSARTLRHYDEIGVLPPAQVSSNGYRWYERADLLRLQRILLLRELRVPLAAMAGILDGEADELAALRHHRDDLMVERDRLTQIIDTVERTIGDLAGTQVISDDAFFAGLAQDTSQLRTDLVDRYGPRVESHFDRAEQAMQGWDRADHERAAEDGRRLWAQMSEARNRGVAPDSDEAMALVAEHHRGVLALWPADAAAYHALGDLILDNPEQRALVGAEDPELPMWLSAAIKAYAVVRLGHHPN